MDLKHISRNNSENEAKDTIQELPKSVYWIKSCNKELLGLHEYIDSHIMRQEILGGFGGQYPCLSIVRNEMKKTYNIMKDIFHRGLGFIHKSHTGSGKFYTSIKFMTFDNVISECNGNGIYVSFCYYILPYYDPVIETFEQEMKEFSKKMYRELLYGTI